MRHRANLCHAAPVFIPTRASGIVYGPGSPPPIVGYPAILSNRDAVRYYQNALEFLGFSVGARGADGLWGDDTRRAIRSFEQRRGLTVDAGLLGPEVQRALQRNDPSVTSALPTATPPDAPPARVPAARPPVASEWDRVPVTQIHPPDVFSDLPNTTQQPMPYGAIPYGFMDNLHFAPSVAAPSSTSPWVAVAAIAAGLTGIIAVVRYYDEKKNRR